MATPGRGDPIAPPAGGATAAVGRPGRRWWRRCQCLVPPAQVELVAAACAEAGTCGLETVDEGCGVRVIAYFADSPPAAGLRRSLRAALAGFGVRCPLRFDAVAEEDWEAMWRRGLEPIWVTPRLVVHPSWCPVAVRAPQLAIAIDPKMAFGTGAHESTRLCLRALERLVRPGCSCLDLGTGSGLLAVAAARLGAGRILALDTDPLAIANARENFALNGLAADRVDLRLGSLEQAGGQRFALVVANIQRSVLEPLLPSLAGGLAPAGRLVLAGLLRGEMESFGGRLAPAGLVRCETAVENEWGCLVVAGGRGDA